MKYHPIMTGSTKKSARLIAVEVLDRFNPRRYYTGVILNKLLTQTEQKQRATDLVFGTLRNRDAIDIVIEEFSGCRLKRIQKKLLNIIRIACYELIYSPSTEQYAIVNEASEAAGIVAGRKQVGFVNALLRQISRHIVSRQVHYSPNDAGCVLLQSEKMCCKFDKDFFPDTRRCPGDYLSGVFSLPLWLVTVWLEQFGPETTRKICFASNRKPSVYIRPNILKTTQEELTSRFFSEGIAFDIPPSHLSIRISSPRSIEKLVGFEQGLFVVQDITASEPVKLLNPQPGQVILDLCSAPGIKTAQLAEATYDSASIVATDIDAERLKMVEENINRLGLKSVEIIPYDKIGKSKFDCILLDVPCSNTGVLAKRIEVRYRIKPDVISSLAKTQSKLIEKASTMLRPGGKICYSTCSIQEDENEKVVEKFLQNHTEFKLESERLILPSGDVFDCDGGYSAIISSIQK